MDPPGEDPPLASGSLITQSLEITKQAQVPMWPCLTTMAHVPGRHSALRNKLALKVIGERE